MQVIDMSVCGFYAEEGWRIDSSVKPALVAPLLWPIGSSYHSALFVSYLLAPEQNADTFVSEAWKLFENTIDSKEISVRCLMYDRLPCKKAQIKVTVGVF